jgi:hypothetical protein
MRGESDERDPERQTEPIAIEQFAKDARTLDAVAFRARHGDRFLVHRGPLEPERRVKRPMRTAVFLDGVPLAAPARVGPPPSADLLVFLVRQTGRSPFPRIITIGRTRNNDVVLPDVMISKFHAFFKEEDGKLLCQDAESRNGSFVDGKRAPSTKGGKGLEIGSGARVKFGLLEFWFLCAAELQELARRSCP